MKTTDSPNTRDGAAIYSPRTLKLYDWWVLDVSNRYAWRCETRTVLLPFFQRHLSANHLDVGVGTGFYLANSTPHPAQKITLLDLNRNSLEAARARVAALQPSVVLEDILNPAGALGQRRFDSISLFFLLHCLPGDMSIKAEAFHTLRGHLTADGTLYGATVLGDDVGHNWLGRRLMKLYNAKGVFGNRNDTLSGLESALTRSFSKVKVWQHGKVALFTAQSPIA
jgi:SAM-dependent methyltransferase